MFTAILSDHAKLALGVIGSCELASSTYLAGGTALALQLGHRKSEDLDFYTPSDVRADDVVSLLARLGDFRTVLVEPPHTVIGIFRGVKYSLFRYAYPMIGTFVYFDTIRLASLEDISAMKVSAITGRATKRDYIDVFTLTKKFPLEKQLELYDKKFGVLGNNVYAIIKALGYMDDAEDDPMPAMLDNVSWGRVREFFQKESSRLGKKYLKP